MKIISTTTLMTLIAMILTGCGSGLFGDPEKKAFIKEYEQELNWLLEYAGTYGNKPAPKDMELWNGRFKFANLVEANISKEGVKKPFSLGRAIKYAGKSFSVLENFENGVMNFDDGTQKKYAGVTQVTKGPHGEALTIELRIFNWKKQ